VERFFHEIFDLPIKIQRELLDGSMRIAVEVAYKRLFSYPTRLYIARSTI